MADKSIKLAAAQANLNPADQAKMDSLSKMVSTHKSLLDMPASEAQLKFQSLPADQQQALTTTFGTQPEPNKRSPLGTAWHYTGGALISGLNEISDLTTRAYRAATLANEKIKLGDARYYLPKNWSILTDAWKKAGDNGELLYNEDRLDNAKKKYGETYVSMAQQATMGLSLIHI